MIQKIESILSVYETETINNSLKYIIPNQTIFKPLQTMSYLSESSVNMLKYFVTMVAFMFVVPITVQITGFVLRTIDSFIRMQDSIDLMEKTVSDSTELIDYLHEVIERHENTISKQQQQISDHITHLAGISQNIDDLYEAIDIVSDRILDDALNVKTDKKVQTEEPLKVSTNASILETDDYPTLLQRSIIRKQNKEVFDQFIGDCIRFRQNGKISKAQLLSSFRRWFWSENTGPLCAGLSDQQVLECMYSKFGHVIDEWKGIVFA